MSFIPLLSVLLFAPPSSMGAGIEVLTQTNESQVAFMQLPEERNARVTLYSTSPHLWETPASFGHRHLLEHLLMRRLGPLDRIIESKGGHTQAETGRDFIRFTIVVPEENLDLVVQGVRMLLEPLKADEEEVSSEMSVLAHEQAQRLSDAFVWDRLWESAYAEEGLGSFGSWKHAGAVPEFSEINALRGQVFAPQNLTIVMTSPSPDPVAKQLLATELTRLPAAPSSRARRQPVSRVVSEGGWISLAVPSFHEADFMPNFLAALALANETGSELVYTPTLQPGLITIRRSADLARFWSSVGESRSSENEGYRSYLYQLGKRSAGEWLKRQTASGEFFHNQLGLLIAQGYNPKGLIELQNSELSSFDDFNRAIDRLAAVR